MKNIKYFEAYNKLDNPMKLVDQDELEHLFVDLIDIGFNIQFMNRPLALPDLFDGLAQDFITKKFRDENAAYFNDVMTFGIIITHPSYQYSGIVIPKNIKDIIHFANEYLKQYGFNFIYVSMWDNPEDSYDSKFTNNLDKILDDCYQITIAYK